MLQPLTLESHNVTSVFFLNDSNFTKICSNTFVRYFAIGKKVLIVKLRFTIVRIGTLEIFSSMSFILLFKNADNVQAA